MRLENLGSGRALSQYWTVQDMPQNGPICLIHGCRFELVLDSCMLGLAISIGPSMSGIASV